MSKSKDPQLEQLEQLEEDAQESIRRGVVYDRLFVSYQFEYDSKLKTLDMKQQLIELNNDVGSSASGSGSGSKQNVGEVENAAATAIKRKALEYRERYHSLDAGEKGVVSLGLNSILDILVRLLQVVQVVQAGDLCF
ncbi:hypothetical protein EDC94DRAFT_657740 [Helicostylum pulchrum]|nr:hypothetical protein EDC94DRAFT_657740 [Helicostylum pulchrum]